MKNTRDCRKILEDGGAAASSARLALRGCSPAHTVDPASGW